MRWSVGLGIAMMTAFSDMAHCEPSVNGGVTVVYQASDHSYVDDELTASGDLFLRWGAGKGEWLLYIDASSKPDQNGVSAFYPTANADAGSVLNRDGDGGIQISEFNYSFPVSTSTTVSVGLIDPSAWLDQSQIAVDENTQFINGSFTNNATIEFPDYTPGVVYQSRGTGNNPIYTVLISGSDGIADLPDRTYQSLLNLTSDERGIFIGAEGLWHWNAFAYRFGGWWRSDDHAVLGVPDAPGENNYGGYALVDWKKDVHAVSLRAGVAKKEVSVATRFVAVAYERQTSGGAIGIGVSSTEVANTFRQRELSDVSSAELYYRHAFYEGRLQVTPSIQHVENPGFDVSGFNRGSTSTILGVRFHLVP